MAVLESVARTYAGLKTLSVELLSVVESGDDDAFSRSGHRVKAWFEAPDRVRIEQMGRRGIISVTDGVDTHSFHKGPKRYSKSSEAARRPHGQFLPAHAMLGAGLSTFLFSHIADKVVSAEVVAEESASLLVSVTYEPPPPALLIPARLIAPLHFSIDSRTHLVSRIEGKVSNETDVQIHTTSFTNAIVNEPIPLEVFKFVPPAD